MTEAQSGTPSGYVIPRRLVGEAQARFYPLTSLENISCKTLKSQPHTWSVPPLRKLPVEVFARGLAWRTWSLKTADLGGQHSAAHDSKPPEPCVTRGFGLSLHVLPAVPGAFRGGGDIIRAPCDMGDPGWACPRCPPLGWRGCVPRPRTVCPDPQAPNAEQRQDHTLLGGQGEDTPLKKATVQSGVALGRIFAAVCCVSAMPKHASESRPPGRDSLLNHAPRSLQGPEKGDFPLCLRP